MALYLGTEVNTAEHRHHAVQLSLGLDRPFHIDTGGARLTTQAAVIGSDHPHRFEGAPGAQAVLLLDPEADQARQLAARIAQDTGVTQLDPRLVRPLLADLRRCLDHPLACDEVRALVIRVVR
jgi:hypothetical protein